ncbi:DUF2721 domain-containing protein [Hymenobacter psoromatis]|uniref:DUF2721 domain-containing protein n=1 Tax=Hymenobacter psoromatis TaxID=1484116 RepID=UPI001CBC71A4|nr:DUF2721 domain-containing protein [Hymenobacter psoromatis]
MSTLSGTLTILSAMFTPAILVSACGSLIMATSQRLSRSLDRQREVAQRLRQNQQPVAPPATPDLAERIHLTQQLLFAIRRARLLQQAMTSLHLTLSIFIGSIFTIGIFELFNSSKAWIIALLSVAGALMLLFASVLLIRESSLARSDVDEETAYLTQFTRADQEHLSGTS